METFLVLNGKATEAQVDEVEKIILGMASGKFSLKDFVEWLSGHIRSFTF
jgi:prophage maintenance system killer protein